MVVSKHCTFISTDDDQSCSLMYVLATFYSDTLWVSIVGVSVSGGYMLHVRCSSKYDDI